MKEVGLTTLLLDVLSDMAANMPESESQRRQAELVKRAFEDILKERDALNKVCSILLHFTLHRGHQRSPCSSQVLKKSEGNNERVQHTLKINEQKMQGLKMQVTGLQEEVRKQQQQLQRLEVEKEGYNKEAMDTKHRCIEQVGDTAHGVLCSVSCTPPSMNW